MAWRNCTGMPAQARVFCIGPTLKRESGANWVIIEISAFIIDAFSRIYTIAWRIKITKFVARQGEQRNGNRLMEIQFPPLQVAWLGKSALRRIESTFYFLSCHEVVWNWQPCYAWLNLALLLSPCFGWASFVH